MMRTKGLAVASLAMVGIGACGTEEAGMTCGPGTHEEGGQCVPDSNAGVDASQPDVAEPDASVTEAGQDADAAPAPPCATNDRCPTVQMVTVHWPNDEQPPYEIDAWETTVGEYNRFLEDVEAALVPDRTDIAGARAAGGTDFRVNQQQVNAQGVRVGVNRPDLQYTNAQGQRVYIEYDTPASGRGPGHEARIRANDPLAVIVLKTIP